MLIQGLMTIQDCWQTEKNTTIEIPRFSQVIPYPCKSYLLSSGGRGPSLSLAGLLPATDTDTDGSVAPAVDTEVELASTLPLVEEEDSGGLERLSTIRRLIPELQE